MGMAYELRAGQVTNVGAGVMTAVTFAAGDNGTVRAFNPPSNAYLESLIRRGATAGSVRVRSPRMINNVQGIRFATSQSPATLLLGWDVSESLFSQDNLTVEADSGAADSTLVGFGTYYTDLGGVSARLVGWGDISGRVEHVAPIRVATTAGAAVGNWGSTAITATEDLMEANRDYAVLGYVVDTAVGLVSIVGTDTGNMRIGGPGASTTIDTSEYFVYLSQRHNRPHIPLINAANKANTNIAVADNAAATATNVTLVCALLSA